MEDLPEAEDNIKIPNEETKCKLVGLNERLEM